MRVAASFLSLLVLVTPAMAGLEELFDGLSRDFGMVPHGSVQIHRFVLTNTTTSTIRVNSVRSSCKCATPKVEIKSAAPGEQIVVEVEYNTRTFTGSRSMTITVTFDQPRLESVALRVSGYSRQDVVFNPSQVSFGVVSRGKSTERTLKVEYAGPDDFKITEVIPPEGFEASIDELYREPRKAGYNLKVKLPESASPGNLFASVQLKTNDPKTPILTVPVTGVVEANLSAAPDHLEFGQVKMGEKLVKKIVIKAKEPFTLAKVVGDIDGVSVKSTEGERTAHIIEISYSPTHLGEIQQKILLQTSLSGEEPLAVNLSASVVEK
jgi:hypothetical protein